jgi:hypothetical protein
VREESCNSANHVNRMVRVWFWTNLWSNVKHPTVAWLYASLRGLVEEHGLSLMTASIGTLLGCCIAVRFVLGRCGTAARWAQSKLRKFHDGLYTWNTWRKVWRCPADCAIQDNPTSPIENGCPLRRTPPMSQLSFVTGPKLYKSMGNWRIWWTGRTQQKAVSSSDLQSFPAVYQ